MANDLLLLETGGTDNLLLETGDALLLESSTAPVGFQAAWARGSNAYIQLGDPSVLKNVASQKIGAQMVSATDGSAFTGAVTVYVTGDAGTQAAGSVGSGACTHEGNGYHTYAPAQAETNYDLIAFTFTGTGAIPATVQVYTLPATGILAPTTAGRTLDVSATGEAGIDWANVGSPTTTLALTGTTIASTQKVDIETIKTQTVTCAAGVTVRADVGAAAAPGAANGMLIGGSNAATTFASVTISGLMTVSEGILVNCSTTHAVRLFSSASGGSGFYAASTNNGAGVTMAGHGGLSGLYVLGGSTGPAIKIEGGSVSGSGVYISTTNGHAINLVPLGTNTHGILSTGGNAGTCDGIKAVAGTGGVPIRGDITGNITGNLSGSVGSVTGAVGSVTGNVGGNVTGSVGSVTGAVGSVTGNVGGNVTGSVGSIATGGIAAASFAAGAIDAAALAASAGTEIADALLVRNVSNVEASAGEHTLCTVVLAMLENSISGTTLTIKRTDGSTTHATKTLTTNASAEPIVGID